MSVQKTNSKTGVATVVFGLAVTLSFGIVGCGEPTGADLPDDVDVQWDRDGFYGALAIGPDGTGYSRPLAAEEVFSIDPDTGETGWSFDPDESVGQELTVDADGTVYAYFDDRSIVALDGDDGSEVWTSDRTAGELETDLAIGDGFIVAASENDGLYAFDLDDGSEMWRLDFEDGLDDPVVGYDNLVYVVVDDTIYAVDAEGDGSEQRIEWSFELPDNAESNLSIGADGTVYVFNDVNISAVDGQSGEERWTEPVIESSDRHSDIVLDGEGILYFTAGGFHSGHDLVGINPEDGQEVFRAGLDMRVEHVFTPAVADDGMVYVGTWKRLSESYGTLVAIDTESEAEAWRLDIEADVRMTLIDDNGNVWAGGPFSQAPGELVRVSTEADGPADAPWTMHRASPQKSASVQ